MLHRPWSRWNGVNDMEQRKCQKRPKRGSSYAQGHRNIRKRRGDSGGGGHGRGEGIALLLYSHTPSSSFVVACCTMWWCVYFLQLPFSLSIPSTQLFVAAHNVKSERSSVILFLSCELCASVKCRQHFVPNSEFTLVSSVLGTKKTPSITDRC